MLVVAGRGMFLVIITKTKLGKTVGAQFMKSVLAGTPIFGWSDVKSVVKIALTLGVNSAKSLKGGKMKKIFKLDRVPARLRPETVEALRHRGGAHGAKKGKKKYCRQWAKSDWRKQEN